MKRYAETFFRYWLILLIPIIVLPAIDAVMIKARPKPVLTSAKIWVEPSAINATAGDYNQYLTPAQNEADALNQLLLVSSFDWKVAQGSPIYRHLLTTVRDPHQYVATDLQKNVQFTAPGDNLVYIGYSSQNGALGVQVVQSLLANATLQMQQLNQQQATNNLAVYTAQLHSAQQRLNQSTHTLTTYMQAHNISTLSELSLQQAADPTFASLYAQVQSDQQTVLNLRQKMLDLQTQTAGTTGVNQGGYHIADPPTVVSVSGKKKMLMEIAIFFVIGLAVSGSFVVGRTLLDRSLRYADEIAELLELPVFAVLPYDPALAVPQRHGSQAAVESPTHGMLLSRRRIG